MIFPNLTATTRGAALDCSKMASSRNRYFNRARMARSNNIANFPSNQFAITFAANPNQQFRIVRE
jgi:hypothetical protein